MSTVHYPHTSHDRPGSVSDRPERRQSATGVSVLAAHVFVVIFTVAFALLPLTNVQTTPVLTRLACLLLVGLFFWSLWSWQAVTGVLFAPYPLFLLAAYIFNGGLAVLELLDLNQRAMQRGKLTPETFLAALI